MKEKKIIAYKGFDKNLKCRDFQYEVGKDYEMYGDIKCCERGFHACESPLEVFDYYDMLTSRFAKVEMSGEIDKEESSTKICSSKINVKAELKLSDMINLGVEWIKEVTSPTKVKKDDKLNDNGDAYAQIGSSGDSAQIGSSGNSAQIGSSGDYAQIGSSGDSAKIGSSGNSAQIGSSGDYAKIGSSGDSAQIGSSGDSAQIGSSGNSAQIGSSGDSAQIGSSGDSAQIGSSGNSAQIGSSGDFAKIGSSGDSAKIGSSGYYAKIGSSGDSAKIGSSGDSAQIGSSGYSAKIESTGEYSVVMAAGYDSMAKAKIGSWITLAEWKRNGTDWVPICVKTEQVDGERIKADTFYKLVNGEFKEAEK
ncbi:hypothetical protein ABVC73_05760 [Prevotella melaninogenica]